MSPRRTATPEVYLPPAEDAPFNPRVPGIDYGVLDGLLGYAVRRAQIVQYELFIASLARWNITPPRFSALVIISLNPNLKLTELANVLGIARSGAVALINSLESIDYVRRVPCPTDKRALGLELTDRGRADLDAIIAAVIDQDKRSGQSLNADERAQLITLLGKIAAGGATAG
ncbi:MAG TPA: MarR family transcriptional regulator [Candidatus Aquabacterium excrementipullorum]|nr:MarR family transcriptional regulator [Candidatus Aquabacterium excrementipullorum]